jgi:hypothetical protein
MMWQRRAAASASSQSRGSNETAAAACMSALSALSAQPWQRVHEQGGCVQLVQQCAALTQLEQAQSAQRRHPPWLAEARMPVLVGGHIGFTLAYFIGIFTIYYVTKAYKKLELKVCCCSSAPQGTCLRHC